MPIRSFRRLLTPICPESLNETFEHSPHPGAVQPAIPPVPGQPREKNSGATPEDVDRFSVHDEFLVGISVAMNGNDLARAVQEIERAGCVRGVDFVVTSRAEGVLDKPLPNWLSVESRPVTLTPEQLSAMNPMIREAIARQPPLVAWHYAFVPQG